MEYGAIRAEGRRITFWDRGILRENYLNDLQFPGRQDLSDSCFQDSYMQQHIRISMAYMDWLAEDGCLS